MKSLNDDAAPRRLRRSLGAGGALETSRAGLAGAQQADWRRKEIAHEKGGASRSPSYGLDPLRLEALDGCVTPNAPSIGADDLDRARGKSPLAFDGAAERLHRPVAAGFTESYGVLNARRLTPRHSLSHAS